MGAVFRWVKYIYEWCKNFAQTLGGAAGVGEIDALAGIGDGVQYFVDWENGDNANDGLSWAKAVKTIGQAITLNNATWLIRKYNTIWVKPGVYPEFNLPLPLFCHLIGLGVRGTDTMVEIHPVAGKGPIFTGNSQGTHLANLWLEIEDANTAIIDAGVLSSAVIEHCTFRKGADVVGMTGIETDDSHLLEVRHCSFESGVTDFAYGMYFRGGADKYLHNARIHDNVIFADVGIWIEGTCTASEAVIQHNKIIAGSIGVDDNQGGSYVIENFISSLLGDAIDHAGDAGHTVGNRIVDSDVPGGGWEL